MPQNPPSICGECGKRVESGARYCAEHEGNNRHLQASRERNARRRSHGLKRLYDSAAWRVRMRRFIIARDPLCRIAIVCGGRDPSVDVDHIVRAETYIGLKGGDETFFFDPANARGGCHRCHAYKTALENSGRWHEQLAIDALRAAE